MEWYIRFNNSTDIKWVKAYDYQIECVENYINHGINPFSIKITFNEIIKKDKTIYTTYLNEYGEKVEMLYDTPLKIAYINRITDIP
jgi:hypothetical protein